jgi:hypothetical protein
MSSVIDIVTPQSASNEAARPAMAAPAVDRWYSEKRLGGLSRFAVAITILNIFGHTFLGFEQPWIVPFVALGCAYATEFIGETVDAWANARRPRYAGSVVDVVKFLLSAHISGLAVGMLLYGADQLWPIAFGASAAVASKYIFRVVIANPARGVPASRHFLNPSNFGITLVLILFPAVGIAPPYQFTEETYGFVDWLLPLIVICTGSYLNTKATGRIPLIVTWVTTFAVQALVRATIHSTPWQACLAPMTGFAFILFTFYMITDPATSPSKPAHQALFAVAVAAAYGVFMELHLVFGLFYALTAVTVLRGVGMTLVRNR